MPASRAARTSTTAFIERLERSDSLGRAADEMAKPVGALLGDGPVSDALRTTTRRVWQRALRRQFARRCLDQHTQLIVAGVQTERRGRAVGTAQPAQGAHDHDVVAAQLTRRPAHAGFLAHREQVARRGLAQQFRRQRQPARRPSASVATSNNAASVR